MIFSFNELKRIANLNSNIKVEDVVMAINTIGFEVESTKDFTSVEKVKFGKILKITKNPNADNLNVCDIQFKDKKRVIQTNASNVYVGMIIAAFVPGSKANGIQFSSKEIRGIVSEGMLTNPSEFGISKDLLREQTKNGIYGYEGVSIEDDVNEMLGLDDVLIDVDILSNRSDASSYYVMAMEIAAFFGKKAKILKSKNGKMVSKRKITLGDSKALTFLESKNDFKISITEEIFLAKHGIKSINNAADISNLTFLYSGLPTHVYDSDKVGNKITTLKSSDVVKILGDKQVKLKNNLVIKDENQIISVASVIGLENSKSKKESENLLFELGIFNPSDVRESVKVVKINTNASQQGSRKISFGTLELAIAYLTNKLKSFSNVINLPKENIKTLNFSEKKLNKVSGFDITNETKYKNAKKSLENLGFIFDKNKVTLPTYRHDIDCQEDLNEEIFRFYGYDNFIEKSMVVKPMKASRICPLKQKVLANGYTEVKTYSLLSQDKNKYNPFNFEKTINLKTFVSKEREVIRDSQAYSLFEIASYNIKRNIKNINIFSVGIINNGVKTLALMSSQNDFHSMQKDLVNIIPGISFLRLKTQEFHPNIAAEIIFQNSSIGYIAKVHPKDSKEDLFIAEIKIQKFKIKSVYEKYDASPLKFNDINIILKKGEDIQKYITEYKDKSRIEIIDVYKIGDTNKITIRVYE